MEKVAIIGTGIAGMGAAHYLHPHCALTLFEADNRIGGHTNTVYVAEGDRQIPIDTGFIVFNNTTYPHLLALFTKLNVPVKKTGMSFAAQIEKDRLEYCGTDLNRLFSQRRRIFSPRYLRFLLQLNRFNTTSTEIFNRPEWHALSVAEYVQLKGYHADLLNWYLLPMSSALWSTPPDVTAGFPALALIRFFHNHGFLGLHTQFQWYTVDGGSEVYKQKLIAPFRDSIFTNQEIRFVKRLGSGVELTDIHGEKHLFDKVIIATHADQALHMLADAREEEINCLKAFSYQKNTATLHTDTAIMPRAKRAWSSWNYRVEKDGRSSCTYWMNSLQQVSENMDYFVTINEPGSILQEKIIRTIHYEHPVFTVAAMQAQQTLPALNVHGPVYFCGSYFRYGFHEDALMSAVELVETVLKQMKH